MFSSCFYFKEATFIESALQHCRNEMLASHFQSVALDCIAQSLSKEG